MKNNSIFFIIFLILIFIVLIDNLFFIPKYRQQFDGYQNEASTPNEEVSQLVIKRIYPSICIFIIASFLYFIFKIKGVSKFAFPLMFFTIIVIISNYLVSYGTAAIWIIILCFPFNVLLFVLLTGLGKKLDNK